MKKIITLLFALFMLLALTACNATTDENMGESTNTTEITDDTQDNTQDNTQSSSPTDSTNKSASKETTTDNNGTSEPQITPSEHIHNYKKANTINATCTEKGYRLYICSCGVNYFGDYTEELGHSWLNATCTKAKTCNNCHISEGTALGHNWENASCASPKKCSNCGITEGIALPHNMSKATCSSVPTCKVCGYKDGDRADHRFKRSPSDCTKDVCTECGEVWNSGYDHDFWFTSCTTPSKCINCEANDGKIPGHRFKNGECTVCNAKEIKE